MKKTETKYLNDRVSKLKELDDSFTYRHDNTSYILVYLNKKLIAKFSKDQQLSSVKSELDKLKDYHFDVGTKMIKRRADRRTEIINEIANFFDAYDPENDKNITMNVISKAISVPVGSIWNYFNGTQDLVTQLFIDTFKDTEDKEIEFFDFYMANLDKAKFVFDLKTGVRLDQIEWFDNSCKEKLGYIVAKILENDNV